MYNCAQANLCLVDVENQTIQLPEDFLTFPGGLQLASEIIDLLDQYNIPARTPYRLVLM